MISAPDLSQAQLDSPLGRTSPVVKLAVRSSGWWRSRSRSSRSPVAVAILALGAGMWLGGSRSGTWPGASPAVAGGPRHRPVQHPVLAGEPRSGGGRAGHDRAVPDHRARADGRREPRAAGARHRHGRRGVRATTDSTKLVDSLVQQARVPERFAYGTLAAYQAIPRFAEDLATLRQARASAACAAAGIRGCS